jgi:hypothetical protein
MRQLLVIPNVRAYAGLFYCRTLSGYITYHLPSTEKFFILPKQYIYIYKLLRFETLNEFDAVENEKCLYPYWESNPDIEIFLPLYLVSIETDVPQLIR